MLLIFSAAQHDPARDSALSRAVQQIEKQYGKGAVMKMDGQNIQPIEGIPTGSLSLDIALGGVGVAAWRVLEIFRAGIQRQDNADPAHCGEPAQARGAWRRLSTRSMRSIRRGAKRLGGEAGRICWSVSRIRGSRALEICEMLKRSNAVDVIVVDSVAKR